MRRAAADRRREWVGEEILLAGAGRVRGNFENRMAPPEDKIDPIQYAWGCCNQGVALPVVLSRGAFRDPTIMRLGGGAAAAKAVTHSGIIRRRLPRQALRRS